MNRSRNLGGLGGLAGMATLAGALAACFHPTFGDQTQCGPQRECPSGLTCGADNVCFLDLARTIDAATDAPYVPIASPPLGSLTLCVGTFIRVCVNQPMNTAPVPIPDGELNTETSTFCMPYTATPAVDACVVVADTVTLPTGSLRVTGRRKLIILSTRKNLLQINSTIDVASHADSPGPASGVDACSPAASTPITDVQGGGGFGGSLGDVGGAGGAAFAGGVSAQPGAAITTAVLRASCPGSTGAVGLIANSTPGRGGRGGGAIYIVAEGELDITGTINASGAGGEGASEGSFAGGGGGGTGGMIVLESDIVNLTGHCFANGGGGGGGANQSAGFAGGEAQAPQSPGLGGPVSAAGVSGSGGQGGSVASPATVGERGGSTGKGGGLGGGGGGGSVGIIRIIAPEGAIGTTNPALISPLPTTTPK